MPSIRSKEFLMIPGPTPVPDEILEIHGQQPLGHRSKEFASYVDRAVAGLKWLAETEAEPLLLTTSGTGAMDAAIANTINRGEKVLSLICGVFGERFAKIAEAYGAEVERHTVEAGKAIDPKEVEKLLAADKASEIKAVTVTHNETSTGVINDLEAISKIVKSHGALLLVDTVTSLGAAPVRMDAWNLDVVVAGSQKALMLPPGLAVIYLSEAAWKKSESCTNGRFYLDLARYKKSQEKSMTPFTPNVSLIIALVKSLEMMQETGKEEIYKRHQALRKTLRKALIELGLNPVVEEEHASPTITSIWPPEGISVSEIRERLKEDYRIVVADGQEHLKGKIFRIGHMGYVFDRDIGMTINALTNIFQSLKAKSPVGQKSAS